MHELLYLLSLLPPIVFSSNQQHSGSLPQPLGDFFSKMDTLESREHIVNEASSGVSLDTVVYAISLCGTGALIFLLVYIVITLSDLECDYLNAQECCYRLNMWVVPKLTSHAVISVVFFASGHYWLFLASVPLALYLFHEYWKVPPGNFGVYDPTEILKHGHLKSHMKDTFIGIAYYLVSFFIYFYCLLTHLLRTTHVPKPTYADDIGL